MKNIQTYCRHVSALLLCAFGVGGIAMQNSWAWLAVWMPGVALAVAGGRDFRRHAGPLYVSVGILAVMDVDTNVAPQAIVVMGSFLMIALLLPWAASRYVLKTNVVEFSFGWGQTWSWQRIGYCVFALIVSSFVIPYYLNDTEAYRNWTVKLSGGYLGRLFFGTNALGIWDELFFINVVFATMRRYFRLWWANVLQAVLFTSFLYELGFTGWGPLLIYPFALLQGLVYERTRSLLYVIAIHLIVDLVLYLALIECHHPGALPFIG